MIYKNNDPLTSIILNEDFEYIYDLFAKEIKILYEKCIFISGASGMIGSYISLFFIYLNRFHNTKIKLVLIVRNHIKLKEKLGVNINNESIRIYLTDIVNEIDIEESPDYYIHAASLASPDKYLLYPVDTVIPNIIGSYRILNHIIKSKIKPAKIIFISSGSVFGEFLNRDLDENSEIIMKHLNQEFIYGLSKASGELIFEVYNQQYKLNTNSVRLFHTFGPGIDFLSDSRVYSNFIRSIILNKNIEVKGDINSARYFTYLSDALSGILRIIFSAPSGEVYNLANDKNLISIGELSQTLSSNYSLKIDISKGHNNNYVSSAVLNNYKVNSSKLKKLGWKPKFDVIESFDRTIKHINSIRRLND